MPVRPAATVGSLLAGGLLALVTAAPVAAQTACDAYSGGCVQPPAVLPETQTRVQPAVRSTVSTPATPATPATLPFTGGEIVLVSAAGAAAVAGGVALLVAGRRRGDTAA